MDDTEVRAVLRELGEVEELPEENAENRAGRLRQMLSESEAYVNKYEVQPQPSLLLKIREEIAEDSLQRAKSRLLSETQAKSSGILSFAPVGSMYSDPRLPMSVSLNEDQNLIGIAGWSNTVSLWTFQGNLSSQHTFHTDKVQCIDIQGSNTITGSFDKRLILWSSSSYTSFKGHQARVNACKFHPYGKNIISSSHDMTWRLWDISSSVCILSQEGHNRGVYALAVHPDGSLIATTDLSGLAALWDLRTGKNILVLKSHLKAALACSIAPNGYQVITGSEDHTLKVWDIRKKSLVYTIPAHNKLVSAVSISQEFIASGSYDGTVKIWRLDDFSMVQSIGHDFKVTDVCFGSSGDVLVSTCFDRTYKIWTSVKNKYV